MFRISLISLLTGLLVAAAIAVCGPVGAGAQQAFTNPDGSATNGDGTSGPPQSTVSPTINHSGTVTVGTKLSCTLGTWADDPTSYRQRWRRNRRLIHTGATYTIATADAGFKISCWVVAYNAQGASSPVLAGTVRVAR